jgi:2-isopropylmalate synthase
MHHQDGFLKHRENYEIIDPSDVGADASSIILTARSGRAALFHRVENLGYTISKQELDDLYKHFLDMADKKKQIEDHDLLDLLREVELIK